jgi:hypothetical protein
MRMSFLSLKGDRPWILLLLLCEVLFVDGMPTQQAEEGVALYYASIAAVSQQTDASMQLLTRFGGYPAIAWMSYSSI